MFVPSSYSLVNLSKLFLQEVCVMTSKKSAFYLESKPCQRDPACWPTCISVCRGCVCVGGVYVFIHKWIWYAADGSLVNLANFVWLPRIDLFHTLNVWKLYLIFYRLVWCNSPCGAYICGKHCGIWWFCLVWCSFPSTTWTLICVLFGRQP